MYTITFSGISHPRCERMSTSKLSAQDIKGTRKKSAHFVTIAFDGSSFRILLLLDGRKYFGIKVL